MPSNGVKLGGRVHLIDASLPNGQVSALTTKVNINGSVNLIYLDLSQTDQDGNFVQVVVNDVSPIMNVSIENEPGFIIVDGQVMFKENNPNYPAPNPALTLQNNSDGTKNLLIIDPDDKNPDGSLNPEVLSSIVDAGVLTPTPSVGYIVVQG